MWGSSMQVVNLSANLTAIFCNIIPIFELGNGITAKLQDYQTDIHFFISILQLR